MDCEYILTIRTQGGKIHSTEQFHSATLEEAETLAVTGVKRAQADFVDAFPFAPPILKGELYRQIKEIDGSQFLELPVTYKT